MRKLIYFIFICFGLSILVAACSKSETYADKLKKEKKLINAYIGGHSIKVVDEYPPSGVFAENEYFRDPQTGIYIHVIDSGNGERAVKGTNGTTVNIRFSNTYFLRYDTITYNNTDNSLSNILPMSITFGNTSTYTTSSSNSYASLATTQYTFLSQACALPLEYVGNHAVVSIIVPFSVGSYYQQYVIYEPLCFGRLSYTFDLEQE